MFWKPSSDLALLMVFRSLIYSNQCLVFFALLKLWKKSPGGTIFETPLVSVSLARVIFAPLFCCSMNMRTIIIIQRENKTSTEQGQKLVFLYSDKLYTSLDFTWKHKVLMSFFKNRCFIYQNLCWNHVSVIDFHYRIYYGLYNWLLYCKSHL